MLSSLSERTNLSDKLTNSYKRPRALGRNIEICGIYVTNKSAIKITKKYGKRIFITLSIVTPPTRQPVNNIVPTGGVIVPIDKLKQRRIPN